MWSISALLLFSNAEAKSSTVNKCSTTSGTVLTSSLACSCMAANTKGYAWWDGIYDGYLWGLDPEDRTYGTCYDNVAYEASMVGAPYSDQYLVGKILYSMGYGQATKEKGYWFQGSWGKPAQVIVSEEPTEINLPVEPEPGWGVGLPTWEMGPLDVDPMMPELVFALNGEPYAQVALDGRTLSEAIGVDLNDDNHPDLVLVFEDGEIWQAFGPFDPADVIWAPQL